LYFQCCNGQHFGKSFSATGKVERMKKDNITKYRYSSKEICELLHLQGKFVDVDTENVYDDNDEEAAPEEEIVITVRD
jgi:hypothetical protein